MLRSHVIGSSKLAAQAAAWVCDVMEIEDLDAQFEEDNWNSVASVLPSSGAASLAPEQEAELQKIIKDFTAETMSADKNQDGKQSKEEFVAWVTDPSTSLADEKLLTKCMKIFANKLP